jgi:hypothetical protein
MQILKESNNQVVNIPMPPLLSFLVPGTNKFQELEIKSSTRTWASAYSMSLLLDNDRNTYTSLTLHLSQIPG